MATVTITNGILRGKYVSGTYEVVNNWYPETKPHYAKGDVKFFVEIDGKVQGVWVDLGNFELSEQIQFNKIYQAVNAEPVARMTNTFKAVAAPTPVAPSETAEEMRARINKRFSVMDMMTKGIINKSIRSLIISGAPGIGKTFTLNRDLQAADDAGEIEYTILNGKMSPIGLYCKLFECASSNSVLVLDDVDVFSSEDALNLLKAALDTSETRKVCWSTASSYLKDEGIPLEFEFEGTIVFISNVDFDRELSRGSKLAPHLDALISRSVYLDLGVHTNEEIMVRVEDVILNTDMMFKAGLLESETLEILEWMKSNISRLRNVSLRTALYLASFVKTDEHNWKEIAEVTQLR
ncbi:hypothetical protein ZZ1p0131 [Acinetobacter phage ZZ1]|jgi:hypothetical protein|uniref:AAA+ ATPase domain-containing protein n=3 Tax=Caudoviricetes TaxID=2731619 RepID=A0A410T5V0_9CAUD|nr:hypothetical protein ZZ1p0131 [Acinetobacter phage ZZ1]AFL47449.1 hypothetical protein ZZ1p0131 [Acinetobacter phage ZZ1]QAU03983.1 hypothetical protein Henu6_gp180 [Acinetobacter phage Henu6]